MITLCNDHDSLSLVCIQLIRSLRLEIVLNDSVNSVNVSYMSAIICNAVAHGCLFFGSAGELVAIALVGGEGPAGGREFEAGG